MRLLLALFLAVPLSAETIWLKSGGRLDGTIVGQTRTTVTIRTAAGDQVLRKDSVRRIQYGTDPAAEKAARDKAEAERVAAEKAEADRAAAEKAARDKAEADRIAAEKAEADRIAAEKAAADRVEAERQAAEKAAAEKAESDQKSPTEKPESTPLTDPQTQPPKTEEQKTAESREAEKDAAEKAAREKAEADRVAAEKAEADRAKAERAAREKEEAEKRRSVLAFGSAFSLGFGPGTYSPAFLPREKTIRATRDLLYDAGLDLGKTSGNSATGGQAAFLYSRPRWMIEVLGDSLQSRPRDSGPLLFSPAGGSTAQLSKIAEDSYRTRRTSLNVLGGFGILPDAERFQTYAIAGVERFADTSKGKSSALNVITDLSSGAEFFSVDIPVSETASSRATAGEAGVLLRWQFRDLELRARALLGRGTGNFDYSRVEIRTTPTMSSYTSTVDSGKVVYSTRRFAVGAAYPLIENLRLFTSVEYFRSNGSFSSDGYASLRTGAALDLASYYQDRWIAQSNSGSLEKGGALRIGVEMILP